MIIASPGLPFIDAQVGFLGRRLSQRRLNLALLGGRPDLQTKILQLRERLRTASFVDGDGTPLLPEFVSAAWRQLGAAPDTAQRLEGWLDRLLDPKTTLPDIASDLREKLVNGRRLPQLAAVREALHEIPLLYLAARDDPFFGFETRKQQYDIVADPQRSKFVALETGGHGAVFGVGPAKLVSEWVAVTRAARAR